MTTAVLTNECQNGVIGTEAVWPALAQAAAPAVGNIRRLLEGARAWGVPVVHLVAVRRPDLRAANNNAPLFKAADRSGSLRAGSSSAQLLPELGPHPGDLVFPKTHGLTSLRSTGADSALRNLGIDRIVLAGVSLNVAIPTLAFEGVNLGYEVTVARDAVAGVPSEYGEQVLEHTLSMVAEVATTDRLIAAFSA